MSNFHQTHYNPDVLTCLANLSNDEVFTPPEIVNQMLNRLPEKLWSDKNARFLDPVCKSGVFLREIAKRLIVGLANEFPDLQARLNHIFTQQLYGIAITELTGHISRRSVYCTKYANSVLSICTEFGENTQGNIRYRRVEHKWKDGKCTDCGASQEVYGRDNDELENHAYAFIHGDWAQQILETDNMKFDVIIGNPPYQLSDGGDDTNDARSRGGAIPLYHRFVEQAKKLNPDYLVMIIPSRWFAGGRGLDEFRQSMLADKHIRYLVDYPVSSECFPGVEIKGGVCYFLRTVSSTGDCKITTIRNAVKSEMTRPLLEQGCDVFIRYNEAISIYRKVNAKKEKSFAEVVSTQKPFGFRTFVKGKNKPFENSIKLYANKEVGYVDRDEITQNLEWVDKHKVMVTMAYGAGEDFPHQIINKPFYAEPNSCCTETYLVIGTYNSKKEAENVLSYMRTRFFRFMVLLRKNTQHAAKGVYQFVPKQDFSKPWTDTELYAKYGLTTEEITFIEKMVRPMELEND